MIIKRRKLKINLSSIILRTKKLNVRVLIKVKMIMIGKGCGKVYIFKFKNVQYHQAMLSYMILWFNMYN